MKKEKKEKIISAIREISCRAFPLLSKENIDEIKADCEYDYQGEMDLNEFVKMLVDNYFECAQGDDPAEFMYEFIWNYIDESLYDEVLTVKDSFNILHNNDALKDSVGEKVIITTTDGKIWEGFYKGFDEKNGVKTHFVDVDFMIIPVGFPEEEIVSIKCF